MITAEELIQIAKPNQQSPFKLATVVGLFENGTAKIQFDGEEEPSEKEYAYFSSYRPVVGDRVLLAKVGGTYVIMNSIAYNQPAQPSNLAKVESGSYVGDGASVRTINIGFTPKLVICYGNGERPTTAKGITISNAQYAIGKYWETSTHDVGIISSSGSAAPKIVDNGFEVKHTDGYATLNVPDITYYWVAIG